MSLRHIKLIRFMLNKKIFTIFFALTVIAIRFGIFLFPNKDLIISGIEIHHIWIGLIILVLGCFIKNKLKIVAIAIGLGLVADEFIFMLLCNGQNEEYWSHYSISGACILALVILIFANSVMQFFRIPVKNSR